jgi:hypothetical protein
MKTDSMNDKEIHVPIGCNNIDTFIYRQVLAIATSYIQPNSAGALALKKMFHNWPWLWQLS